MVYAHNTAAGHHDTARDWWQTAARGPEVIGVPWVVVLAFVRLLSSPRVVPNPARASVLMAIMEEILLLPAVKPAVPGSRHASIMKRLFEESGGTGRLATDVHIAALALEFDATVATNDTDFSRFAGLKIVNPLLPD